MSTSALDQPTRDRARKSDLAILFAIAAAFALLHLLTNNRYGFHRDGSSDMPGLFFRQRDMMVLRRLVFLGGRLGRQAAGTAT